MCVDCRWVGARGGKGEKNTFETLTLWKKGQQYYDDMICVCVDYGWVGARGAKG